MGSKRAADDDGSRPATEKRQRPSTAAASSPYTSKRSAQAPDLTYGQRAAFGDLGDATVPIGDDLEWEDETDALAYLRSVRQEARGIPNVLAASRDPQLDADRSIYDNGRGDFRAYYHDGAYVAFPEGYQYDGDDSDGEEGEEDEGDNCEGDEGHEGDEDDSEATSPDRPRNSNSAEIHATYFASLIAQYEALRRLLHSEPPGHILAALPRENTPEVGSFASPVTFKQWSGRMRNNDPLPAQVASMHKDGVIRLLRILLGGNFFRKGHALRERTSCWLWALLARLPGRGELDYQEIGCIRELGKRAVLSMVSLAEAEILQREYGVGDANAAGGGEEGPDAVDHGDHGPAVEETRPGSSAENSMEQDPKARPERVRSPSVHITEDTATAAQAPSNTSGGMSGGAASSPDVEMQDDSDMEDEGEVSADPPPQTEPLADLETAKLRLLAQLNGQAEAGQDAPDDTNPTVEQVLEPLEVAAAEDGPEERAKDNVRATLNMILTVAGEFYGQRDLLEFRDPFGRVLEESG